MAFRFLPVLILLTAATAVAAAPASTPGADEGRFVPGAELDGTWEGILSNGGMGLPLIFVIRTRPGAGTTAVLDISDPSAKDIPVAGFRREKDTVFMEIPAVGGTFDGLVAADLASISGRWVQAGATGAPVPLILNRKAP
ncbi:MAG: hypothetical protein AB7E79_13485 [Rhodospirillaceae bacterium]